MNPVLVAEKSAPSEPPVLPLSVQVPVPPYLFGGGAVSLSLYAGLTVLLGPNGAGKTHVLRALIPSLQGALDGPVQQQIGRRLIARFVAAGRSAPLERHRGPSDSPHHPRNFAGVGPAPVGNAQFRAERYKFESLTGDLLALQDRADLRVKVEARLQALFRRRLRLQWTQQGLELSFVSGSGEYSVTTEASGVVHLVGLLAALYDDQVGAILIDEAEVSLHPQMQAILLEEVRRVAGDPTHEPGKKLVVLSTHAQGMLPLRRIDELPNLVFFTDATTAPRQVPPDADELKSRRLTALVARLGESHRAAFFAPTVLLVDGPSDEIVVSALAAQIDHSLARSGAQIVPVIGKGEIPETVRMFRLMGKRIVVLADLDALADDNTLVTAFAEGPAREAAIGGGHPDLLSMDRTLRNDFAREVADRWAELEPLAAEHPYLRSGESDTPTDEGKRRRRAALAVLLSTDEAVLRSLSHWNDWAALRRRFDALLNALEAGGCFPLRRGTIEDYYLKAAPSGSTGKPEAAVAETAAFAEAAEADLRQQYADVLRAIECAAPAPPVDENAFLRGHLGGLLGVVFQMLTPDTTQEDLNIALAASPEAAQIFALENVSAECGGKPALRVRITSPLFARPTFPAVIRRDQNPHVEVERLLQ